MTDDLKQTFNDAILEFGYGIQYVPAETFPGQQRPLAYTVGRTMLDRPELVISGPFDRKMGADMLAKMVLIDDAEPIVHGQPIVIMGEGIELLPVTVNMATQRVRHLLCSALAVFGKVQAIQLLWGDDEGRYPGDPACSIRPDSQEIL